MRDDPAFRAQRIILVVLQGGVAAAFLYFGAKQFLAGDPAIGLVCLAGAAYAGFRTWQIWRRRP